MRQKDLSETIFLQDGLEHLVLDLRTGVLAVDLPIFAAVDILDLAYILHDFIPDLDSFLRGEESEEAN